MKRHHRAFFELLLRLFPVPFRKRFGEGMRETFEAACREHSVASRAGLAGFLVRTTFDMTWSGFRERLRPTTEPERTTTRRANGGGTDGRQPTPIGRPAGRWGGWHVSWLDVKLGLRMLVKYPGLAFVAVVALAVGIPIGLSPTHLVNAMEAPPPVEESDRVQLLRTLNVETSAVHSASVYDFQVWREVLTSYEALGASRFGSYNVMSEDGRAAPVSASELTASMFDIFRVPPLHGRTLVPSDEVVGAPAVVVLGYDLWQSRLGGDPDVVGRSIRIGGVPHEVVGVMPEDFKLPLRQDMWLPLRLPVMAEDNHREIVRRMVVFGRLAPGVSPEEAQAELTTVTQRIAVDFPEAHERFRADVLPYTIGLLGFLPRRGFRGLPSFYLFQALSLLVLAVPCATIGMLMLARTATRSEELAVRTALGASRARVIVQLFVESLVLAVPAAGLGLLIGDRIANRYFAFQLEVWPSWIDLGVTPRSALWALTLAVFSAAVVGVVPALRATGKNVHRNIQNASAGRAGIRLGGMSSALIVADVALTVAVLGVAVGMRDTRVPGGLGIQTDQFLSATLRIPPTASSVQGDEEFSDGEFRVRFEATQRGLVERLAAEPGIGRLAIASALPGTDHPVRRVEVDGDGPPDGPSDYSVRTARVDVGFFDALEQPILTGRGFTSSDLGEGASAVIVNTNFVDRVLGGRNPIGRRVRYRAPPDEEPAPWFEIVGVVGHLGMFESDPENDQGLYHPLVPGDLQSVSFALHVGEDPASFTPRLRALVSEVDPTAMISNPLVLSEVFSQTESNDRWLARGIFVGVGILLALSTMGIYALMSLAVAQRTREIGIRIALGAGARSVALVIGRRALVQLALGAVLGMMTAEVLLNLMGPNPGETTTDSPVVLTVLVGVGAISLIGLLACSVPMLRALRVQPTEALHSGG